MNRRLLTKAVIIGRVVVAVQRRSESRHLVSVDGVVVIEALVARCDTLALRAKHQNHDSSKQFSQYQ